MAPDRPPPAEPPGERSEDQPGWAAPSLPPTEPATAPLPPPGMPAAPPPGEGSIGPPPPPGVPGALPLAPPSTGWAPGWPPTAPWQRSRRWLVVLVAVLALALGAAIAGTVLFVDHTLPPYNAAHDFIADIVHGRTRSAAARLCADDREDVQGAIDAVRSTFGFGATTVTVNVLSVDRDGNRATVDYDVNVPHEPTTHTLEMRRERGEWKACPRAGLR